MYDLFHYVGGDLFPSDTGDLLTVSGTKRGEQRVLRRLLTNPGEYLWNPLYGAGLPRQIGEASDVPKIRGIVRSQIFLEQAVSQNPSPQIDVSLTGQDGGYTITIRYTDSNSGEPVVLFVDPNNPSGKASPTS